MADPKASIVIQLKDLASKGLTALGGRLGKIAKDAEKAKFIFAGLATAVGLLGFAALKTAGNFEMWRVAFTTMLGSAGKADLLLRKIRDFALKTPFDLPQVVMGSKRLLAFGIAAADIIPTMRVLGDVSSGVGVDIGRLTTVFGQVRAAGRLMGQEVLQFTNAGVPILELLAKKTGKSQREIKKLGEQGQISFEMVRQVLFESTEEGGRFHDMMKEQNKTLIGSLAELSDEITEIKKAIGDALLPTAKDLVQVAIKASKAFGGWVKTHQLLVVSVLGIVGGFSALMVVVGGTLAVWGPLVAAFSATVGVLGLMLSPIGLLIASVAVLTSNFAGLGDVTKKVFKDIMESVTSLGGALSAFARGNFSQGLQIMKAAALTAFSDVMTGFGEAGDNIQEKWKEINDFFESNKIKAVAGVTLGDSEFGGEDTSKIDNLIKDAEKEIEIALNTSDQLKQRKIEDLAWELRIKGEGRKADELLESFYLKRKVASVKQTLGNLSVFQKSKSKELAAVGKAAAIGNATIATYEGATKALASVPFPFGFIAAASVVASGLANVATIAGVPLAQGGVVLPTSGGTNATIGEAGSAEAVIPLDDEESTERIGQAIGGGGPTFNIGTLVAGDDGLDELARRIDEKFFHLDRTNERNSD